jgi:NADP-dependent 3-hydroxy acid dehydrogenase YdfG
MAARLEGKVAIVTGGGSGIGKETAKLLAREGAQVVIAGRRKEPLDKVVAEIERAGGRCTAHVADLTKMDEAVGLAQATLDRFKQVDILVNNAGFSSKARNVRWIQQDEWDRVMAVNLTGVYRLTQAVLPGMIERGGGTVVTVSSFAAVNPGLIGGVVYGAAKAGVVNLMGHIHNVLRDKGIRATSILPAEVDTPILDNRPHNPDAAARATMMQPEDVAEAILLCCTLPMRTVIQEIVIHPTRTRDMTRDIAVARDAGAPPGAR